MWTCKQCKERHQDSFGACWQCGTSRAGVHDVHFDDIAPAVDSEPVVEDTNERPLPPLRRCKRCSAQKVFPASQIIDHDENYNKELSVAVDGDPHAWVFKDRVTAKLKAWICGGCGHTEIWCPEAARLFDHYCSGDR